ncbi:MAG: hypothetical protein K0U98_09975 [Deltaproteobacteria bacterium]|nr:hypothetical protein [Deltaproteobacteria bacterium]
MLKSQPQIDAPVSETLENLTKIEDGRFQEVEVFAKLGRARRVSRSGLNRTAVYSQEQGWAVRASDSRGSFFCAGTGQVSPQGSWPGTDGLPLKLPSPITSPAWQTPADFEAPLMGEREAQSLLEGIERALRNEIPGAQLLQGTLDDGTSETQIINSRGIRVRYRSRLAALHLESLGPGAESPRADMYIAEREARHFSPLALARRLADRLLVLTKGTPRQRDRGEFLLAPPVMARLLESLLPLWVGPGSLDLAQDHQDSRGRLGSEALTILDNGRLMGGALEAPADGEGVPTREMILVDRGSFRQPLLSWQQIPAGQKRYAGCSRRASWRDIPKAGPTHLYLKPSPAVAVTELLENLARGYYLLDTTGAAVFDWPGNRFYLPVCGFEVRQGRASAPVSGSHLCGAISALLQGIQAVGRDLSFLPFSGMIGSPSAVVSGLELRALS